MSDQVAIDENCKNIPQLHKDVRDQLDYIRLSQFYKVISKKSDVPKTIVEKILDVSRQINYQVPANNYFTLNKPHLIGCTALQFALENNKLQIFQWLLRHGANIMTQNSNNESILHLAFKKLKKPNKYWPMGNQSNQYSFIDSLLSSQINMKNSTNLCNNDALSHFHIACMRNNVEAVKLFLQNSTDINQAVSANSSVSPGFTPLHFAAKYSALETAELLLKHGADANLKDKNGMTPLHLIVAENMDNTAKYRVDSEGYKNQKDAIDRNKKMIDLLSTPIFGNNSFLLDSIGLSRLHVLSTSNDISKIEQMIGQVTNLNHSVSSDSAIWPGYTALHFAAHCSHETFIFLLNKGADILAKDAKGFSPFDMCMKKCGTKDLYSIIMTQPAWKDIEFPDRKTKLVDLLQVIQDERKFLDFLNDDSLNLNMCISRNSTLWPGYTILHFAVLLNDKFDKTLDYDEGDDSDDSDYNPEDYGLKTIKKCISKGCNISAQDIYGKTPLHLAFRMQRKRLTELLLRHCSTKNNPIDEFGLSHLHIACASGFQVLAKTFLDRVCGRKNVNSAVVKSSFRWYQKDTCESSNCWMSRFLIPGSTPLHTVVSQGNMSLIRLLLRRGADIYAKDANGITPVHQSLSANFSETHILRDFFVNQNLKDSVANCGLSHLHVACYVDSVNVARKLLDEGADIEGVIRYKQPADCHFKYEKIVQGDEFAIDDARHRHYCNTCDSSFNSLCYLSIYAGCTPLMMAMKKNSYSVILLLVQRGANYLARTPNGSVMLYDIIDYHIRTGHCSWVPKILRYAPAQQTIKADIGLTLLHIACISLDVTSVGQLLGNGFDPNAKLNENSSMWPGYTPLHLMLVPRPADRCEIVITITKMLLTAGADVTVMNAKKETPIHFAHNQITASKENPSASGTITVLTITELLLKFHKNFNIDVLSSRGITHFHVACVKNEVKIVNRFLQHGVDVNHPVEHFDSNYGGFTALHLACSYQCQETVDLLLQYGANVFSKDSMGNTPLQIVTKTWHQDIFHKLIAAGADVNAKNSMLQTPFETFLKSNKVTGEAIQLFMNHGCNVNVFNPVSQKGLIGLACQSHSNIEAIEHEPVYNAIMSAPNIHEVDDMGRTPIHNLVSVNEKGGSMRYFLSPCAAVAESIVYNMKVIDGFTKLGHDIDHQDARGRTALHAAVPFDNRVGIMALLANGADFNIKDANGNTPYMLSFERSKSKSHRDARALEMFSMHVRKLKLFGLYVCKENLNLDEIVCQQHTYYSQNKLNIEVEVEVSQRSQFGEYPITLYDFLFETRAVAAYPTMPRAQRQIVDQVFEDHRNFLQKNFPGLVGISHLQYRKAVARGDLIKCAAGYLNSLTRIELPTLCSDKIFEYLVNDDLKNFLLSEDEEMHPSKRRRTV